MFGELFKAATDVVKVVAAPIEMAASAARVITKPAADLAEEAVEEVKDIVDDITD